MSKARSPREVCSTTMGTSGLIVLASFASSGGFLPNVATGRGAPDGGSAPRGPELTGPLLALLLARLPELLARLRLLDSDRLRLAHEQLERLAGRDVLAEAVEPVVGAQPLDQLVDRRPGALG